ncbi:hypothetical protein Mhypo_01329 [Meiothermus hypogaeus]|jgi:hypothetical protein|uniref:Uncharacterized protein n=1 Tax=Meiothermus hypogaeus TaxID=884155 RepID=A0ABX9MPI8_9DEIN|nr:hypothetical protein Mhypo_01329 [Meiothermus hypogaeus]GIW30182.1 MAG: hypothetical protein KatS3mg071_0356 [Meiothermus sp.]
MKQKLALLLVDIATGALMVLIIHAIAWYGGR